MYFDWCQSSIVSAISFPVLLLGIFSVEISWIEPRILFSHSLSLSQIDTFSILSVILVGLLPQTHCECLKEYLELCFLGNREPQTRFKASVPQKSYIASSSLNHFVHWNWKVLWIMVALTLASMLRPCNKWTKLKGPISLIDLNTPSLSMAGYRHRSHSNAPESQKQSIPWTFN